VTDKNHNLETLEKDWTKHSWALVFHTLAQIAGYFHRATLAQKLYLRARDFCVYSQDYYGGAYLAEKGGDIEGAINHYINAGFYDKAKRLAERHGTLLPEHYWYKVRTLD
jgi:hypothetical protein